MGVRAWVGYRWKALRELFRSNRVPIEVTGVPEKLCFAESREGDSATLRAVTRPPVVAQPVALAPSLSWCVPGTQWRLALARIQSTRVLPCLLSSIPPDRRPAICLLRPQELHHRRLVAGLPTRRHLVHFRTNLHVLSMEPGAYFHTFSPFSPWHAPIPVCTLCMCAAKLG